MGIGKNIKEIRTERGYTQLDVANAVNVSEKTVSSWEVDRTEPNVNYLMRISDFLKCPVDALMGKGDITPAEYLLIDRYRSLDDHGRKLVSLIIKMEHDRCN